MAQLYCRAKYRIQALSHLLTAKKINRKPQTLNSKEMKYSINKEDKQRGNFPLETQFSKIHIAISIIAKLYLCKH